MERGWGESQRGRPQAERSPGPGGWGGEQAGCLLSAALPTRQQCWLLGSQLAGLTGRPAEQTKPGTSS